jgi:alpha-amylase/alpha-mannosidase (GH57 family)
VSEDRRRVCVHGHFYQPPRENPWTGAIDLQPSAAPFHDWNERITRECYEPNAAARILDERGETAKTASNYARMSFNFGPTLLSYLETQAPRVYRAILDADRESLRRFGGHGSAMAQGYNHAILPLASREDKLLQVVWGMRDFAHRFGRRPGGMWLPETAVDVETLEVLAQCGIRFTVLAPAQASAVREPGGVWRDAAAGLDTTVAYECPLPSGRSVALFFYDGALASGVAFQDLLQDGEKLAARLLDAARGPDGDAGLAHLATDGETYGHHKKFGEMALARALARIESDAPGVLTNYAAFLAERPPRSQARVVERSSWSCFHGVERWRSGCDCGAVAEHPEWTREWRAHLRSALDWLDGRLKALYAERAARLVTDPAAALLDSINVLLDGGEESRSAFLARHRLRELAAGEIRELWSLLELRRFGQLMFTSCGWFFEDVSRIETLQVLRYAARAAELAREVGGTDPQPELLSRLAHAKSNHPDRGTARDLWSDQRQS